MKPTVFLLSFFMSVIVSAQNPFDGNFKNEELNLRLRINLYEPVIPQPQFEDELCFGVLSGSLNGQWIILKVNDISDNKASVRAISNSGIEAQNLEIELNDDQSIDIKQVDSTNIRGVKNNKYIKLPKHIHFDKK